jgi:hypothetical protein
MDGGVTLPERVVEHRLASEEVAAHAEPLRALARKHECHAARLEVGATSGNTRGCGRRCLEGFANPSGHLGSTAANHGEAL